MDEQAQELTGRRTEKTTFNTWFIISIVITIFLITLLAWHLFYSSELVASFERRELAIQRISGELRLYTKSLELAAKMAAASGDMIWEAEYLEYRAGLEEVFDQIPELVTSREALEQIDKIKNYRRGIDQIELTALEMVASGERREAGELLAGWAYTGTQLEVFKTTDNLALIMHNYIEERINYEKRLTTILLWVLVFCLLGLIISWFITIRIWRSNVKKKQEKDLEVSYLSYHDSLTGLYNRAFLESEMSRVDLEENLPISIVMLDLNCLKLVNDTYGHVAGDQVLQKGAELLKTSCRESDVLARWGGDEFVILLPGTSKEAVRSISQRIIDECRKTYGEKLPVSMGLGFATKQEEEEDLFRMLQEAEDNMYDHKTSEGRRARKATFNGLLQSLAEKSAETEEHFRRLEKICMLIAERIDLASPDKDKFSELVKVHDIGLIDVPAGVLLKPAKLTGSEWQQIKKHPETGYRIARLDEDMAIVAEGILYHHERWDGRGYPEGRREEEIPLLARILAVADAYEVMSSGRPYREAMPTGAIAREFRICSGKQFDPNLVEVILSGMASERGKLEDIN